MNLLEIKGSLADFVRKEIFKPMHGVRPFFILGNNKGSIRIQTKLSGVRPAGYFHLATIEVGCSNAERDRISRILREYRHECGYKPPKPVRNRHAQQSEARRRRKARKKAIDMAYCMFCHVALREVYGKRYKNGQPRYRIVK